MGYPPLEHWGRRNRLSRRDRAASNVLRNIPARIDLTFPYASTVKIALVTPYDLGHPGGVGEHIRHLKDELSRLGHSVVIIAPRSQNGGLEVGDGFYGVGRTVGIPGNKSKV